MSSVPFDRAALRALPSIRQMRFFVEVTPIGKNDTQKYCVDADSWQKALQHARSIRKEDGSISGFSIELADDGYRAVDPTARLRYMVKKAPANAELSPGASQPPPAVSSSVRPPPVVQAAASSPPGPAAMRQPISVPPPQAVEQPRESRRASSKTMSFGSSGTALLASSQGQAAAPAPAPAAPGTSAVPRAPISKPSPPRAAVSPSNAPPPIAPPVHQLVGDRSAEKKPDPRAVDHDAPSSKRPAGPIVVLYKKEQEPTNASPISYREEVFAAPPGTTEDQAEAIVRAQFRIVSDSLAQSASGKYVNIAVFDRVFEGRPPVPPLVTLSWKDWKSNNGPTITFPRRAKAQLATATQPSNLADAAAQAVKTPSQRPPRRSEPPPSDEQRAVAASSPPARARVEPEANATVVVAAESGPKLQPDPPPQYVPQPAQYIPQIPAPAFVQQAAQGAQLVPQSHQAVPQEMAAVVLEPPAPVFVQPAPQPVPQPAAAPVYVEPAPPLPAASSSNSVSGSSPHIRRGSWKQTPAALDGSRIRVRGDELIGLLFEEMHDLNFMADALEGAAFCLWVALDKLPSKAGFVHFYDIDKREYVVASVAGVVGNEQVTKRNSQNDPWLAEAMRRRAAYVVGDASTHEGANVERFAAIGGARSVIVAPVMLGGRALGAIEIVNPIDGAPFGDDDANALAYMAEQFAEFVSSHGLVTDEGRIRRASLQPPV